MAKSNTLILLLRFVHSLFAAYFIACIFFIWYSALTLQVNFLTAVAIISVFVEGFLVFFIMGGHCPLAPLQAKLNDPVPFFNLFLPDYLAKKAIPFFTGLTFLGIFVLLIRLLLR